DRRWGRTGAGPTLVHHGLARSGIDASGRRTAVPAPLPRDRSVGRRGLVVRVAGYRSPGRAAAAAPRPPPAPAGAGVGSGPFGWSGVRAGGTRARRPRVSLVVGGPRIGRLGSSLGARPVHERRSFGDRAVFGGPTGV